MAQPQQQAPQPNIRYATGRSSSSGFTYVHYQEDTGNYQVKMTTKVVDKSAFFNLRKMSTNM